MLQVPACAVLRTSLPGRHEAISLILVRGIPARRWLEAIMTFMLGIRYGHGEIMNFRQLAHGLASFLPWAPESLNKGTGGTSSARYCYCIWLRHLVLARDGGMSAFPRVVAELGPGDSIGVGLAALLSGAERYLALDALAHAEPASNLAVFDALVELFRAKAPIPARDVFPEHTVELASYEFPSGLLTETQLAIALNPERVAWLRGIVSGEWPGAEVIDYRPDWDSGGGWQAGSVDFVLSNAVMEHVADLPAAYRATWNLLRPGGFASHQIDFRSHGLFRAWDGHWACQEWLWRLFMGRRGYLLNREPFATHRVLAKACGFEEHDVIRVEREPQSPRLSPRFRSITTQDRATCTGYFLLRKP